MEGMTRRGVPEGEVAWRKVVSSWGRSLHATDDC